MDFVIGFPKIKRYFNSIWVIFYRMIKLAYFLPVGTTYGAEDCAKLYIYELCQKLYIHNWLNYMRFHYPSFWIMVPNYPPVAPVMTPVLQVAIAYLLMTIRVIP